MTREEKINILKLTPIFKELKEDDFIHIAEVSKEIYYKNDENIFIENDEADAFYIIAEGEVEIIKKGETGPSEILALKKKFDVFGEMAVIDDLPRSATARAKTNVKLLKISKTIFNELLKSFSHIGMEMAKNICLTVRNSNMNYINDLERRNKELKNALYKLKKTQNELIRLEKLSVIGKFSSLIIHDIKNPMTNIKSYAELIKLTVADNEKVVKSCNVIGREVDRLSNMTSELLEFSRGEMKINKTPVNISSFISTIIDTEKESLNKKNITIIFKEKIDAIIFIDLDKLARVFTNLINNATDALLTGGKIVIKTTEENNWIKLSILDNGIGMDQKIIEKIFDPFFSYNKKNGTGLGMTIVKSIIEAHNGYIKVLSKKNSGTKFELFLPKI